MHETRSVILSALAGLAMFSAAPVHAQEVESPAGTDEPSPPPPELASPPPTDTPWWIPAEAFEPQPAPNPLYPSRTPRQYVPSHHERRANLGTNHAQLRAIVGDSWADVGRGIALILGGLALAGIAIPVGLRSERYDIRRVESCFPRFGPFPEHCSSSYRSVLVGHDPGLLAGSIVLAGAGLVAILVGGLGVILPATQRRKAALRDYLRAERRVSLAFTPLTGGGGLVSAVGEL